MELRYGVNPHQKARVSIPDGGPLRLLAGQPSYINLLDALNAWALVRTARATLDAPAATSFKHVSPAGAAIAGELDEAMRACWGVSDPSPVTSAYVRARDCDPKSSFGDMIAVSDPVDTELAELLTGVVSDGLIAPGFDEGTIAILAAKKRGAFVIFEANAGYTPPAWERREVFGVTLEQELDQLPLSPEFLQVATGRALTGEGVTDALLGMLVMRYTQSNSVGFLRNGMTLGVGAGQQSRVDCTRLAGAKAEVWWMRRHPTVQGMKLSGGGSRQDLLNWQMIVAQGDMTLSQRHALAELIPGGVAAVVDEAERETWMAKLDDVTVVHDAFIPFRDNIDFARHYGARNVVEPGGSVRTAEVKAACDELGVNLIHTGTRLFHH
ncbi:MAG: phosphoribosylaminoimidazolecarboxamide formyltransferase [Solirubrobacteraceae bacterium]